MRINEKNRFNYSCAKWNGSDTGKRCYKFLSIKAGYFKQAQTSSNKFYSDARLATGSNLFG